MDNELEIIEDTENSFDFIVNDDDEIMLLLYVCEGDPKDAVIEINVEEGNAVLHRSEESSVELSEVPADIIEKLQEAETLLVCELSIEENEDDTEIMYAYEADINF